jgi:PAS domain-containing protein
MNKKSEADGLDRAGSFEGDLTMGRAINRRNPVQWLIVCGALMLAAIVVGTAVMVFNFRERALSSSARELENTVLLMARHFDQEMEDLGVVQNDIVRQMESANVTSSNEFKTWMSSEDMHEMLKAKMNAMSYVGVLSVYDADGQLIASSNSYPVPAINIADQKYFMTLRSDPSRSTVLSEPYRSRFSKALTAPLGRRISGPNGEFLGVISRGIEPNYFGKFFASLALQDGESISIVHREGGLLARYPQTENTMIGQNFKLTPAIGEVLAKNDHGTMRLASSPLDGQDKLAAFHTLTNYPLLVVATASVSNILEGWRTQTRFLILAAALSSIIIAALVLLIIRQLRDQDQDSQHQLQLEKRRLLTAVNNMTQGLLLFDASGRLVICNQRYLDMYKLSPNSLKPGQTQKEILALRYKAGTFARNVDDIAGNALRKVCQKNDSGVDAGRALCPD